MRSVALVLVVLAVSEGCFFWLGNCNPTPADTRNGGGVSVADDERIVNNGGNPAGAAAPGGGGELSPEEFIALLNTAFPNGNGGGANGGIPGGIPGGNQGGNLGPNHGGNLGGNLGPNHGGNLGGNLGPNHGGNLGGNLGPNQGGNLGGNHGGNLGGNHGGNLGPNQGGNLGGNHGGNLGGNHGGNLGGNLGPNHGGNLGGNQGGNVGGNLGGNQGLPADLDSLVSGSCDFGSFCVPYYLCEEGNIITDGAGIIDIRFGSGQNGTTTRSNSKCPGFLEVCCHDPDFTDNTTPQPPKYTARCGQRKTQSLDVRIIGPKDNEAQVAEFPWMVAILRIENVGSKEVNLYVCGGSLIHENIILTAAHCVAGKNAADLKVRLGEWDTQQVYERYPHQDRRVSKVQIHPGYLPGSLYNDFALLFLDSPAELTYNVDTICMPSPEHNFNHIHCWATGWGKDNFGKEGKFQSILKAVNLPVVPKADCQGLLQTTRLGKFFRLHNSFMCAGGEAGVDTCKGDGGSPLVCEATPGVYVQAGIVAWGIGCGENNVPGVYADVIQGSDWIKRAANDGLAQLYGIPPFWPLGS